MNMYTYGPKRVEGAGDCRSLYNVNLHNLYASPNGLRVINSRKMRLAGHVARMGEIRNEYDILVRKREGNRPLGRPRRRWGIISDCMLGN
jgi:hypothetical protein